MTKVTKTSKILTPDNVRFSYANVLTPGKGMDDSSEPKYSVAVLVPKTAKATLKAISQAIEVAKDQGKEKWGGKIPATLKLPMRDGDAERPDDPAYEGMFFFNASSKRKPQVIDRQGNLITDPMDFYSGCWGRITVNFYPFNVNGNRGIGAGLGNIMKTKEDESLSGGNVAAVDDFADLISEAGDDSTEEDYDFG